MRLRRADAGELDAIGDLTVAAYETFMVGPEDPYLERLRETRSRATDAELWVAADGDRLLGTVTSCPPGSPWRELADDHEGEFRMLAVHPDARGRGVGTALAGLCEERASRQGATSMVLSSLAQMHEAHRIYERLGYHRVPERDWQPVPGVHLIAYAKELT